MSGVLPRIIMRVSAVASVRRYLVVKREDCPPEGGERMIQHRLPWMVRLHAA